MIQKLFLIMFSFLIFSNVCSAEETTGYRKILDIGCHSSDGTCYATLSGNSFGAQQNCSFGNTNEFRFDSTTIHGRRTCASLLSAFLTNKPVSVTFAGCFNGTWPTIAYFRIQN